MRRYHIQDPSTYTKYNRICGSIRHLAHKLALLDPSDPVRRKHETLLLEKLHVMGILPQGAKMSDVENKVTVAAFCRRRLPVVMTRLRMCETVHTGVRFVEQGHVRVGPEVVVDPAYLVTRYVWFSLSLSLSLSVFYFYFYGWGWGGMVLILSVGIWRTLLPGWIPRRLRGIS